MSNGIIHQSTSSKEDHQSAICLERHRQFLARAGISEYFQQLADLPKRVAEIGCTRIGWDNEKPSLIPIDKDWEDWEMRQEKITD